MNLAARIPEPAAAPARQISMASHRAVSGGWILACLLGRFGVRIRQRSPRSRPGGPGHRGHRQVGLRERVGIRAVPGIRPRRPADLGRGRRLVRPARRRGRGPCPGLATGQPPRPRRDGPIWPGHTPRRPGTRPDMAGRQRQLVLLTRVVRRYNSPDGSAFPPPSVLGRRQIRTFWFPVSMHNHASSWAIGAGTALLIVNPKWCSRAPSEVVNKPWARRAGASGQPGLSCEPDASEHVGASSRGTNVDCFAQSRRTRSTIGSSAMY